MFHDTSTYLICTYLSGWCAIPSTYVLHLYFIIKYYNTRTEVSPSYSMRIEYWLCNVPTKVFYEIFHVRQTWNIDNVFKRWCGNHKLIWSKPSNSYLSLFMCGENYRSVNNKLVTFVSSIYAMERYFVNECNMKNNSGWY